jgi:hypothetical protein
MKFLIFIISVFLSNGLLLSQPTGNCVVLNGSTDYYEVADNSTLDPTSVVSFEAWINPYDTIGFRVLFTKLWCNSNRLAYYFGVRDGSLVWLWDNDGHCGNGSSEYRSNSPIIIQNKWQHVAVVHTSSGVNLYYNGNLVSGGLIQGTYSSIYNSDQPLKVAVYKGASGNFAGYFNGRIDELRKWNYALSQAEILARMNAVLLGNEPGLELYHNMDNVSGSTIINGATSTGAINNSVATYGVHFL